MRALSKNAERRGRGWTRTPLGAVTAGLVAGAFGTLAMDLLRFARYRRGGGESGFLAWETSLELDGWDDAPAPALVGKRLVEGLFDREVPPQRAALVNSLVHWGFGMLNGAQFGLVAGSLSRSRIVHGVPFGAAVWASGYVILPAAKLYEPIWEYDLGSLADDLGAHVLYGVGTATCFKAISAPG